MNAIRRATMIVGVTTLLAVSGCGGTSKKDDVVASDGTSADTKKASELPTQAKTACDLLTQEVAKSVLGSVAGEAGPAQDNRSADIALSSCVRANNVARLDQARSASLIMRVARTETGSQSNAAAFEPAALPGGAQSVSGYGDKAFWNPTLGQLSILDDHNWYVLSIGPTNPAKHTLADAEKLADAIKDSF